MMAERASAADAERFRQAHRGAGPLVLANAWDAASAGVFVETGLNAIATSSGAISRALGYADGEGTPADEMFAAIARIARGASLRDGRPSGAMITADIENGYGMEAAELVERLAAAGAVGCNIEDSDPRTRRMIPAEAQAARITALRRAAEQAGTGLVINARVDLHVRSEGPDSTRLERSVARARAYLDAGADCVFPILMTDEADIGAYVRGVTGPVNIMAMRNTPGLRRLAELGVARVTFGGGLHGITLMTLKKVAAHIRDGDDPW